MSSLQSMSSKSKVIMAKRLEDDFNHNLEKNNWNNTSFISSDNVKTLIINMGFISTDAPSESKLLIDLCNAL
jgi:hypothetical protein